MKIKGIAIQDIHFGVKDTTRVYNELSIVKDYLNNNDLDFLNINGDFFDRKLSLNEPAAFYAILFFDELVNICKRKNIKMRVLQGTRSHDLNQLSIFSHYATEADLDIKFFDTISEEDYNGIKFLYVPEEYPENANEYYKEYKNKKYSVIHGHGTWDFVAFADQIELSQKDGVNTAPIFMFNEWKDSLENGVAIFGHIHGRNVFKKKIFYSGSFSRWGFGERSERGFTSYEIDTDSGEVNVKFINNDLAPKFEVIDLNSTFEDIENTPIEDIISLIKKSAESIENLRIDIRSGLSEDKIKILKETFKNSENIKIENKILKTLLENKTTEEKDPIYKKYSYILNRELPMDQTIQRFIKEEYEKDIELSKIVEVIT